MFLRDPGRTDYDLNFSVLGIDVRVHPFFFLVSLLFGQNLVGNATNITGIDVLLGVGIFFVSILVHELGHSLAFRHFGQHSRIVLYWLGGMAIPERGALSGRHVSLNHKQQIIVSVAGPVAGLLLGVFAILIGRTIVPDGAMAIFAGFIPVFNPFTEAYAQNQTAMSVINGFIIINFILNLLNLLPIYPLDGGQIARAMFSIVDRFNGVRNSLFLSIGTAVICGVLCLQGQEVFLTIFCFYLAWQNYQELNPGFGPRF